MGSCILGWAVIMSIICIANMAFIKKSARESRRKSIPAQSQSGCDFKGLQLANGNSTVNESNLQLKKKTRLHTAVNICCVQLTKLRQ